MTPNPTQHTTTCRICRQVFTHAAIDIPLVGSYQEERPKRVIEFVTALMQHLDKSHKKEYAKQMGAAIQDYTGLLICSHFDTTDPSIQRLVDTIRSEIHRRTQKHFVTDAAILDLVARVGLDPDQEKNVAALMMGMRDAYEEQGEFSSERQNERRIITV